MSPASLIDIIVSAQCLLRSLFQSIHFLYDSPFSVCLKVVVGCNAQTKGVYFLVRRNSPSNPSSFKSKNTVVVEEDKKKLWDEKQKPDICIEVSQQLTQSSEPLQGNIVNLVQ